MATSSTRVLRSSSKSGEKEKPQSPNQRVFAESDETELLETYLKLVTGNPATTIVVTGPIMAAMEASLRLRFSHTQIVDKLRRLRHKYHRQARTKSLIKTPHDQRLFFLSRQIWGKTKTTSDLQPNDESFGALRAELGRVLPGNGAWEAGLDCLGRERVTAMNDDWLLLRIEEAELATRKAELVNECAQLVRQALAPESNHSG